MRKPTRILTVLLIAVSAVTAFGQGRDRSTSLGHLRARADSNSAGLQRFQARHGQGTLRFRGDWQLIGFQRFTNGQPIFREQLDLLSDQSIKADLVWPGGSTALALTGDSVLVGIWDGGYPRVTHVDFSDGAGGSRIDTLGFSGAGLTSDDGPLSRHDRHPRPGGDPFCGRPSNRTTASDPAAWRVSQKQDLAIST